MGDEAHNTTDIRQLQEDVREVNRELDSTQLDIARIKEIVGVDGNGVKRRVQILEESFSRYRQSKREEDERMKNEVVSKIEEVQSEVNHRFAVALRWQVGLIATILIAAGGMIVRTL